MNKTLKLSLLGTIVLTSAVLAGCANTDAYDENCKKEAFNSSWQNKIGDIDPNQNWNMTANRQVSVKINLGLSDSYKINLYDKQPGVSDNDAKLIATADAKEGETTSFSVNLPSAMDTLYIGCASSDSLAIVHQSLLSDNEFTATFGSSSSAAKSMTRAAITQSSLVTETAYTSYPGSIVESVKKALPDGKASGKTNDYAFLSNGLPFTVRPIAGQESFDDKVGYIAIHQDGTVQSHELICNTQKCDNIKIHWNNVTKQKYTLGFFSFYWNNDGTSSADKKYLFDSNNVDPASMTYWGKKPYYVNDDANQYTDILYNYKKDDIRYEATSAPDNISSKGFVINEPAGTYIVFYVRYNRDTFYSLKNMNCDGTFHSAVIDKDGYKFVGLEDSKYGKDLLGKETSDLDCNDVVLEVKGAEVVESTTKTPYTYTIAFEDLGTTDDYDFNDVVLKASYVQNITTSNLKDTKVTIEDMKVSLVAAGGTLPTRVYYNNGKNSIDVFGKEVHEAFGVTTSTMVNTGGVTKDPVQSTVISATSPLTFDISEGNANLGFYIVAGTGATAQTVTLPNGSQKGIAPQGLVIPGNWEWPTERENITKKYSAFGTWGANMSKDLNWYKTK